MVYKVSALVGTEGDAAMDAAVATLWPVRECAQCTDALASRTYDDGLCNECRDRNDERMRGDRVEAQRLCDRIKALFPHMSAGRTMAMATNILYQQDVAKVWAEFS